MAESYFLGCPTPAGFETHFGDDMKTGKFFTYIIKGGPGTGKSTLMKKIADALSDIDEPELYYCSSDPDSLDGLVFRGLGVIFVDGTSPHVFEPTHPGARERLLDLGRCWNGEILKNKADEIIYYTAENAKHHQRAKRYLGAVQNLNADIMAAGDAALLGEKLDSYAKRLSAKLMPKTDKPTGSISLRQITSVTPKGVITQSDALKGYTCYVISDPCFSVTDALLKNLSVRALAAGHDVIASKNVFLGGCVYEHMLLPDLGIAFVSEETAGAENGTKINALRFYEHGILRERRSRIAFNAGVRKELILQTAAALKDAKAVHDDLERCYIDAMDFKAVGSISEEIISKLRAGIR